MTDDSTALAPKAQRTTGSHVTGDQEAVFRLLCDPATHGIDEPVTRIDTAISIVFLAGDFAYKLKRAVKFPYLDFSDPEHRHELCEREIARNQPNAPNLYLNVATITREADTTLALDGEGEAVEWAVRMRRFDPEATLDRIAQEGPLSHALIDDLAGVLARAHAQAPVRDVEAWIADLATYIEQNEGAFLEWPDLFPPDRVHTLTTTCRATLDKLRPLLTQRGRLGHIRLCHGDCHLRNIVMIDGRPVLFDAIEFDDAIATGDVLYDLGFLIMDMWERGDRAAADRLLVRYLAITHRDEHLQGLAAIAFFMAIRATIRSKVTAAQVPHLSGAARDKAAGDAIHYFRTAETLLAPVTPTLIAVGGLSGTGKSTLSMALAPRIGRAPGAVVLRTDVERKALFGVKETERLPPQAYSYAMTEKVYHRVMIQARTALAAGHSVILDAVFADPHERQIAEKMAQAVEAPFVGLWLTAPAEILVARVAKRVGDASDANVTVVRRQLDYRLGRMTWERVDASGTEEETIARAEAIIARETGAGAATENV